MYTEVSNHFEQLVRQAQTCDLPQGLKMRALSALTYFHTQALCDLDRRDPTLKLRTRWQEFLADLNGTNFLKPVMQNEVKWRAIQIFVGMGAGKTSGLAYGAPAMNDRWAKAEAKEFFEHLSRLSEAKHLLTPVEVLALRLGLYYLELETKRARYDRNKSRIRFAWSHVQPLLAKANLLEPFKANKDLVRRVKSFVSDEVL